jgi:hypothetical protein
MRRARGALLVSIGTVCVTSALLVLGTALSACGSDTTATAPPPLATGTPVARDAAAPESAPPSLMPDAASGADAALPSYHFTGSLAATPPSDFGGSPYCKYKITLKQIDVDLSFDGAGEVIGGSVKNLALEESVPPCPNGAVPANIHTYTASSATKTASGGVHIVLGPDPDNQPKASLVVDGDFRGGTAQAALEWHRTDQNAPLDWRVKATIPLVRH